MRTYFIHAKFSLKNDYIHITATGSKTPPKGYKNISNIESCNVFQALKDFIPPGWFPKNENIVLSEMKIVK
jgi:hypothetical protein